MDHNFTPHAPEIRAAALELIAAVGVPATSKEIGISKRLLYQWKAKATKATGVTRSRIPAFTTTVRRGLDAAILATVADLAKPGANRKPIIDDLERLTALRLR